ncbi:MAG: cytidine deaminase [Actinobacteria bacterium]|nr:cytidine deaminase [Actinomycetota bacterium]
MNNKKLAELAIKAKENAYAPYSNFKVGASLVCAGGRIFTGCNVENASYGLTICAEQVAVGKAVSEGCCGFETLVIVSDGEDLCTPCGGCRQFLYEFNPDMLVVSVSSKGEEKSWILKDLLPEAFGLR